MAASTVSFTVGESNKTIWLHGGSTLFYLKPKLAHQPAPHLFIGSHVRGIGLRRARQRLGTFRCKAFLDVLGGKGGVEFLIESRDDRGRRASGRHQAITQRHVESEYP